MTTYGKRPEIGPGRKLGHILYIPKQLFTSEGASSTIADAMILNQEETCSHVLLLLLLFFNVVTREGSENRHCGVL